MTFKVCHTVQILNSSRLANTLTSLQRLCFSDLSSSLLLKMYVDLLVTWIMPGAPLQQTNSLIFKKTKNRTAFKWRAVAVGRWFDNKTEHLTSLTHDRHGIEKTVWRKVAAEKTTKTLKRKWHVLQAVAVNKHCILCFFFLPSSTEQNFKEKVFTFRNVCALGSLFWSV